MSIALVTGATGGLGPAIATALAAQGHTVWLQARRNLEAAQALADRLGGRVLPFDQRDSASVNEAFATLRKEAGQLDVLVCNAGLVADGPMATLDEDSITAVIDTNLSGTLRVCRAATRMMMGRRQGCIVLVSSVAGLRASPYQANYSAAKAGLLGLNRTLARELGPRGIRVNAVVPGMIDAGMGARVDQRHRQAVIDRTPLGRAGTAEEVAPAIAFLTSDAARYITGAELTIDGGLST